MSFLTEISDAYMCLEPKNFDSFVVALKHQFGIFEGRQVDLLTKHAL